ncbi:MULTISPECIES: hypothetical protein [Chryseobacterium]|jgi:hypothetical protein|uniref:C1q domain-containing protein n=1 Tax=Chryseobacterium lathyri TaxID=395933 RepID=A0A511Y626_9FLAO|nr:hypothetical protein [Chryseobacterium lathyri]GEN70639.1 hypothetical protein CLA01_07110 [Chryseobacterium lathyri]
MKLNKKNILFLGLGLLPNLFLAQIGIGINNPNPANSIEINTTEKVIIDKTGKIGVGVATPKMAIDLRNGANGSMAIGMTNQTAAEAGAGAMRYNPSPAIGVQGYIEYSDGTVWVPILPYGKPRIVVMAEKTNNNSTVFETGLWPIGNYTDGIPGRSSAYLTSWAEKLDSDSGQPRTNFDPATGEFIAPRSGVYYATFTFALAPNQVNTSSGQNQTEAIWEVRNSSNTVIQRIKTNNGYPQDTGVAPNAVIVGSACTASLYLNAGDKLRPFVWINVSWDPDKRPLLNTGGYNVLTIVEQ